MQTTPETIAERIVFPLDFPGLEEAKPFIDKLGNEVGVLKVGLELFVREGPTVVRYIQDHAASRIFLDLKFHDIPATVRGAVHSALNLGVHFITVHCGGGRAMLEYAARESQGKLAVLGVTLLTSMNRVELNAVGCRVESDTEVTDVVRGRAQLAHDCGCQGVVCAGPEIEAIKQCCGKDFLVMVPGVRPVCALLPGDDQKRITTPRFAIDSGADYLVIGRPIRLAPDPKEAVAKIIEEIKG